MVGLRHRLTIQVPSAGTQDEHGDIQDEWSDVATVWAQIIPSGSSERYAAAFVRTDATHVVIMRYYPGVTTRHRLRWVDGATERILQIVGLIDPEERHRELRLTCVETT